VKRWIKIVLAIVVALVVIAAAIPLFVNPDQFRPEIETRLGAALNRNVSIGKLSLSLLAGGISASDISISDDPAFSRLPSLQAKSLDVGVEMWPLLTSRTLIIDSITVMEPKVSLLKNASGQWNFSSMGAKTAPGGGQPGGATTPSIAKLTLKNGTIQIASGGQMQSYTSVQLTAENVGPSTSAAFNLKANTPGSGRLEVKGTAGPVAVDAAATPFNATVTLNGLNLGGYLGTASGIDGMADLESKVVSQQGIIRSQGTVKTNRLKLVANGSPAREPVTLDYQTTYNLAQNQVRIDQGDLHLGGSVAHIMGSVDTRGAPVLNLTVNQPSLSADDLNRFLPAAGISMPPGVTLHSGTMSANLNVTGPVQQMVIAGPLHGTNLILGGFDLGSKLHGMGPLAGINTGSNTDIQLLDAKLRQAPDGTRLDGIDTVIAGVGTITGQGTITPYNAMNFNLLLKLANAGGTVGGIAQMAGLANFKSAIPVHVTGTTSNPSFNPDLSNVVTVQKSGTSQTLKNPSGQVGNVLQGLFGKNK
jgi:AsmA protein